MPGFIFAFDVRIVFSSHLCLARSAFKLYVLFMSLKSRVIFLVFVFCFQNTQKPCVLMHL
jgi:hypothetical protein